MSCKLGDKCDNVFACNILRPNVELLGCNFYKPKKPQTNEEWFASLSTKEKAKWMFRLTYKCYWCGREYAETKKYNEKECPFHKCLDDSKGFEKWLKEKHDGNMGRNP